MQKIIFKNYKKIISWLLILVIIFTGINWPTFSSFADATSEFQVSKFDADYSYPYMMMFMERKAGINEEDGSSIIETNVYAIKANTRLYYMSDYSLVVSEKIKENGVDFDALCYKWDAEYGVWVKDENYAHSYNEIFDRNVLMCSYDSEAQTYSENNISYILESELTSADFNMNTYPEGLYIIGYDSLTSEKDLVNVNYLDYEEDSSVSNAEITEINKFFLANILAKNEIFKGITTVTNGKNTSNENNQREFKYDDLVIGDSFVLPTTLSFTINDSIMTNNQSITLNVSYVIESLYVLNEDTVAPVSSSDEFGNYVSLNGTTITLGKENLEDSTWSDDSFIVELKATTSIAGSSQTGTHSLYLKINTANSSKIDNQFNSLIDKNDFTNNTFEMISFINAINSDFYSNNDKMVTSSLKILNKEGFNPKELNTFRIYDILENNYFNKDNLDLISTNDIIYEVTEVGGVDDINSITEMSNYVEFKFNDNGYSEMLIDGNAITEYRKDSRNTEAFNYIIIKASREGYNDAYFKVTLNVVQYLYGGDSNVVPTGTIIRVANIEFSSALTVTYAPMVTNLKYLDFAKTYQTLINYSDYQLLFYTSEVPMLNEGHYLEFDSETASIEIYKNTNGSWEFYNYLNNVEDIKINLPLEAGYRSIEFNSYMLMNKVTNEVVLTANEVDEYYNMQLRGSMLPATYLNGGENSIYTNSDGYNYYYVMRKGQNTYFMYKTNTKITSIEGGLVLPEDLKVYALMQNIWIPCSSEAYTLNGFNLDFLSDFENYLLYTNDATYGNEIPDSRIGSVDYFKYIPNFFAINGYNYLIAETSEGLEAIQWTGADLTIEDGILSFKNIATNFDVQETIYQNYAWLDSESITASISEEGLLKTEGFVGSILYSSIDIYDSTESVKVFSSGYSNSSIVVEELTESDYPCTAPDLVNVFPTDEKINLEDYTDNGETSNNVLLMYDGIDYYAYYVPYEDEIFFDSGVNTTSEDTDPDIYIELFENESVNILITVFDNETNTWKYKGYETFTQTESDTIMYLYYHLNIEWFGTDISCPDDSNRNITSKDVVFSGEAGSEFLKDFEYEDENGDTYVNTFVNGATLVENEQEFAQFVDDADNYWIMVVDSFQSVYDPLNNSSEFKVGTENSMSFTLYAPLYSSTVEVLTARGNKDDIISSGNGKSSLYTNGNSWFSGNEMNDDGKPIINTIYISNNQIKISTDDLEEYQMTFYESEDFDRFVVVNDRLYEKIPFGYYEQIEYTVTNGIESKITIDGHCYELKDETYTLSTEIAMTVNGKNVYYVLENEEKLIRREIIDADNFVLYTPSGIYDSYMKIVENGTIFDEEVVALVNGVQTKIEAGKSVPKDALISFSNGYVPVPTEERKVVIYTEDKFGNRSEEVELSVGPNSNNQVIFGTADEDINNEINEAIEASKTDSLAPNIYYAYIYKGELYLGIKDVAQEGATASGLSKESWSSFIQYTNFENINDVLYDNIIVIEDSGSTKVYDFSQAEYISLVLGDLLPGSEWAWNGVKGDGLKITGNTSRYDLIKDANGKIQTGIISLGARDANFNEAETITDIAISEELNNNILFGADKVPIDIIQMLQDARDGVTEDEDNIDTKPVIDGIYILNGVLYVEAHDDKGIANYGFQWKYMSTMKENFTGKVVTYNSNNVIDEVFENTTIKAGDTIKARTICYRNENFMAIKIPNALTIEVIDTVGNKTTRSVYPTNENQLIYGNVSETIKNLIEANGGTLTPPEENSYPVITSVYTYQGYLYVEGYADDGLHTYAYGFRVDEDSIYPGQFAGYDVLDNYINITAGRVISSGSKIFKDTNYQRVNFPTLITVSIRDITGDETSLSLNVTSDNMLYYGEPPIIKDTNGDDVTLEDGRDDDVTPDNPGDDGSSEGGEGNDPSNPGDGDDEGGSGDVVPGDDDSNVKPETENTPGIILPDAELDDVDWTLYDYVLQLLDKDTERVVYSIRKDTAESIEVPKLQDSTTYIYKQLVIDESTEAVDKTVVGYYSTTDTIAPIITKVWFSNYRLYVSAYDEGGLDEKPYLFSIQGTPVSNKEYSVSNNIRVVYNDRVSITVVDEAGNKTTVVVTVKENTADVLYECVNPKSPVFVRTGTSKSTSYWLAYLQTKYNVDIDGFKVDETNCSNIAFTSEDDDVVFDFSNDGVLTYYNKKTNKYYALTLRTLNAGKSYRSIIVQEGSEIDFALAFERKLLDVFGTTDGITWATDDSGVIKRDTAMILANNSGVARIVASKDGVKENFYIVVGENISSVKSSVDFTNENFAYTYLIKDNISLVDGLEASESDTKYLVIDSSTDGISRIDDNNIRVTKAGRQTFILLDVVNDEMLEYTFEAVLVAPFISTFTDIIGSENRADIEYLCERGIISQYPDFKYKSANKMTTKEFLTMLNRVRLTYDSDFELNKEDKEINLDMRDFDYYSSMNILSNLTQEETDEMLGSYSLNKAITFEEVVSLISSTLLYDEYHTQDGYEVPDGLENVSEAALHLLAIGIIDEDDARNGTREVTKAEIAYMLSQTIRFLEY